MRLINPFSIFSKRFRLWRKSKRLAKFKRAPKIFIPTPSRWQIVIPYKPIGVALIVVLTGLCIYLIFRSDLLLVRKMEIKGVNGFVSGQEVREIISVYLAKSIVFLDTKEISEILKSNFLPIKEVYVEKHFPDTLVVQVEERVVVATLVVIEKKNLPEVDIKKDRFLVDGGGFVFAKSPRGVIFPELVLESEKGVKVGEKIQGQLIAAALDIIDGVLEIESLKPTAAKIVGQNEVHVETDKTFLVLFTSQKKINEQILALKQIYENAKRQGKVLKKVDLRFKLPVVLY